MACKSVALPSTWRVEIHGTRAASVAVVLTTTTGIYRVLAQQYLSPLCFTEIVTVPMGSSVQIAWVPDPGADVDAAAVGNALVYFNATNGSTSWRQTPEFTVIPGAESVWLSPTYNAGTAAWEVLPGTVATYADIGTM